MSARELTDADMFELLSSARKNLVFLPWTPMRMPVGDPTVLGSYAWKDVLAIYWYGELVYRRAA